MTLSSYFERYPLSDHNLKFLGVEDGIIHVTLTPSGLENDEHAFILPDVVKIDCKLFNAGICKGSK